MNVALPGIGRAARSSLTASEIRMQFKNRRRALSLSLLAGLAGSAAPASTAAAQDGGLATVETETEAGPLDIPGRETGDRTRLEVTPLELPKPGEEVARPPQPPDWFDGKPWWEWSNATGNWGGARTWFEEHGFSFNGSYTLDWSGVWSGGLRTRASTRSLTDFNLTIDTQKFVGLKGGTFFLDFYSTDGRGGSAEDVGDFISFSNIATGRNLDQIAELWYEQWLFDDRVRVKVGKIDANLEFGFVHCAPAGINSAIAVPTTILGFPTYPDPSTSVNLFVYPTDQIYLGVGVYDGATADGFETGFRGPATFFSDDKSSSWFFIGELGLTWTKLGGMGSGQLSAGGWGHTASFARFDGADDEDGAQGFYIIGEQQLIPAGDAEELAEQGLFVYAKYAWADEAIAAAAQHVAGGIFQRGTFGDRHDDEVGLFVAWVDLSDEDGAGFPEDEYVIEGYYAIAITPFITVTPDIQYIINPSGRSDIDDAVVGTLRLKITF